MRARILYISRYEDEGRRLAQTLHTLRLVVDHVSTLRQAGAQLQQEEYDVVLTEAVVPRRELAGRIASSPEKLARTKGGHIRLACGCSLSGPSAGYGCIRPADATVL